MKRHVHDCTGPDMTCPCGYQLVIPPVCVSIEITDGPETVFSDGFNCDTLSGAIDALRLAAETLERRLWVNRLR